MKMGTTHTNFCTADAVAATYAHSMGLSCMLVALDRLLASNLTQEAPGGSVPCSMRPGTPIPSSPDQASHNRMRRAATGWGRWMRFRPRGYSDTHPRRQRTSGLIAGGLSDSNV
jgi:hypothetical protein